MARVSVNPSILLAESEAAIEIYQALMTELENNMDQVIGGETYDDPALQAYQAQLRTEINTVRAKVGFWRGEASFWRNEVNENKTAIKDTNKLAQSN